MKHIKFLGLTLLWNKDYATAQTVYLHEIGYLAKLVDMGERFIIAYSYREFTIADAILALSELAKDQEK